MVSKTGYGRPFLRSSFFNLVIFLTTDAMQVGLWTCHHEKCSHKIQPIQASTPDGTGKTGNWANSTRKVEEAWNSWKQWRFNVGGTTVDWVMQWVSSFRGHKRRADAPCWCAMRHDTTITPWNTKRWTRPFGVLKTSSKLSDTAHMLFRSRLLYRWSPSHRLMYPDRRTAGVFITVPCRVA